MMLSWLPASFKRKAKSDWKNLRIAFAKKSRGFSKQDLVGMLRRLGVEHGDTVLAHSSLDQFQAFLGKPADILTALQEAVGTTGTVIMPTLPFRGSAVEYVRNPRVFDVKKTPSQMGMLTELFRRMPGVIRSVHPTHAVAAWGTLSTELLRDHNQATTPCGRQTPYGRLLDHNGKILFLGTDITVMTFFHAVEEILEPKMPFSAFTKEVFTLESRDAQNKPLTTRTRLFEPQYSKRRNLEKLVPALKQKGWWREARLGGMNALLLRADHVLQASEALAQQGIYCYDA
jgi:aminoglycoside 3-N-acetyltransferase